MSDQTSTVAPLAMLSVEQIMAAPDLRERVVSVPEWGGSVRVRGFTKGRQQALRHQATVKGVIDSDRLELLMFVHGVVEPVFTADHAQALTEKSAGAVEAVLKAILEVSGMTPEARQDAERSFRDG